MMGMHYQSYNFLRYEIVFQPDIVTYDLIDRYKNSPNP